MTPKIIADFETQLATALSIGGTSFTLSSALDDDGIALPAGKYYFTIENGSSNKEFVVGTLSGSSITAVSSVSRQGTETSGAVRAHRVGSSVIISDFLTYKNYMDEIALVSAPDADTSTKGVLEAATLAEVRAGTASGATGANLAVTPDVLDDLPTEDEKAALAGTSGTPSATNLFVTQATLDPVFGDGSDGDVTISGPTTLTSNMYYNNLTVNSTLTTDGYQIFVAGTLSGSGTIDWGTANPGSTPAAPTNDTAIPGGAGGTQSGIGPIKNVAGAAGGTAATGGNPGGGSSSTSAQNPAIGSDGEDGGTGGTGGDGAAGTGTGSTATAQRPINTMRFDSISLLSPDSDHLLVVPKAQGQAAGGGSGCGDDFFTGTGCAGSGGGGGASGGIISIVAKTWQGTFSITSTGGAGGNGANAHSSSDANVGGGGGGAGGNGGVSVVVYGTKTWTGSYTLTGGAGGAGGTGAGGGGTGASGSAGATGSSYELDYSNLL